MDGNKNLKYSGQEKDETEKADSDADPAGEGVHVQTESEGGIVHVQVGSEGVHVQGESEGVHVQVGRISGDIFPPELALQIFLAAAKRGDSCLYGRAQHKADGLQGSSQLVRRHCGQKPGTTREVTTVRFSPP